MATSLRKTLVALAALAAGILLVFFGLVLYGNLQIRWFETIPAERGAGGTFLTVDGHRFHVVTIGDPARDPTGAPIVMVHGLGGNGLADWLPWALRLQGRRAVILIDQLGFGHSERVTTPGAAYAISARAHQLLGIADALGVVQFDLVGVSFGGGVAAQTALDAPEHVRKLILMDAEIYRDQDAWERFADYPAVLARPLIWNVLGGGPFGEAARRCRTEATSAAGGICPSLQIARIRGTVDGFIAMHNSPNAAIDLGTRIDAVATPTLVIWGGDDKVIPVKFGDRLAQALHAKIIVLAKAGHLPYVQQPQKVEDVLLNFLGG